MLVSLNYRDSRPIYEQIKASYRNLITAGGLKPGEKLPSVRELASELAINPNTIQRAYRELETEGYIYSVSGKGSFVAEDSVTAENRKRELLEKFDALTAELYSCGVTKASIIRRLEEGGTQQ